MNKTVLVLKNKIEAIQQTKFFFVGGKNKLGMWTGSTEVNITNKIQKLEERVSGIEDKRRNLYMGQRKC